MGISSRMSVSTLKSRYSSFTNKRKLLWQRIRLKGKPDPRAFEQSERNLGVTVQMVIIVIVYVDMWNDST